MSEVPPHRFVPHVLASLDPNFFFCAVHTTGHFTYECKSTRPYVSRPSRTAQLDSPRLLAKARADGKPSVEVPEEFKNKFRCVSLFYTVCSKITFRSGTADRILAAKEKQRETEGDERAKKRTKRYASHDPCAASSRSLAC